MKMKTRAITLLALLLLLSNVLIAQNGSESKYSIQFNYGIAKTLHYNPPVDFIICFEGCPAQEQKAKWAPQFEFSLYRTLSEKSSVKIGIGSSTYRFWQLIFSSEGSGPPVIPNETVEEFDYFSLSVGYRHVFGSAKLFRPFFETDFFVEIHEGESEFFKKCGVAVKPQIGALISVSENLAFVVDGFYKSGIMKYNKTTYSGDYIPYGYGVEVGVNLKL